MGLVVSNHLQLPRRRAEEPKDSGQTGLLRCHQYWKRPTTISMALLPIRDLRGCDMNFYSLLYSASCTKRYRLIKLRTNGMSRAFYMLLQITQHWQIEPFRYIINGIFIHVRCWIQFGKYLHKKAKRWRTVFVVKVCLPVWLRSPWIRLLTVRIIMDYSSVAIINLHPSNLIVSDIIRNTSSTARIDRKHICIEMYVKNKLLFSSAPFELFFLLLAFLYWKIHNIAQQ